MCFKFKLNNQLKNFRSRFHSILLCFSVLVSAQKTIGKRVLASLLFFLTSSPLLSLLFQKRRFSFSSLRFSSLQPFIFASVISLICFSSSSPQLFASRRSLLSHKKPQKMSNPDSRKRPRPEQSGPIVRAVSEADKILELIRSRGDRGIWQADISKETSMPQNLVTKLLKQLLSKNLIKEVKDIRHKLKKKILMAVEFEPAEEMTGGSWYLDGALNTETITTVKRKCLEQIAKLKTTTVEMIHKEIRKSDPNSIFDLKQIREIVEALKLDREVEEVKSTGKGDFINIPAGRVCYRKIERRGGAQPVGGLASIPCGVCPRLRDCTPDGLISPRTCVYYSKFLQWDF